MNDLRKYFENNPGYLIWKWQHYFDIYDRHFKDFRGKEIRLLEIGVFHGGSLQMWKHYFGAKAKIFGVDIDPRTQAIEQKNISVILGSQADRGFLRELVETHGPFDIIIDDGSHESAHQIITFEELFPNIKENGVYLCEDLSTSYSKAYGGGLRYSGSFIEYSKCLIDQLNAWHSRDYESLRVNDFTRSAYGIHYYDSVLVIEKHPVEKPSAVFTGKPLFEDERLPEMLKQADDPQLVSIDSSTAVLLNPLYNQLRELQSQIVPLEREITHLRSEVNTLRRIRSSLPYKLLKPILRPFLHLMDAHRASSPPTESSV